MKRAFLFGLGSFLILGIIGLFVQHDSPNVIMALVLMPVSAIAILAANNAPVDAVILAVVFIIWAVA
jgi:hypothetical protein